MLQLIERWRIILIIKITYVTPNIFSNHKRSDGVYGAQRNYTSIPFKAKPFLCFVGKSPSLVLEISEKIETI